MADFVLSGLHAVGHNRAVAKGVVGLPIIGVDVVSMRAAGMGIAHGKVADKRHGCNGVEAVIHPNGIVNAH